MEPLLCVTVAAPTMAALRASRDAVTVADLVELRLDSVDRPDVAAALQGRRTPVVVTCRANWEGGGFQGSEEERRRILEAALAGGAEYVDVEAAAGFAADLIAAAPDAASSPRDTTTRRRRRTSRLPTGTCAAWARKSSKLAIAVDSLSESLPLFALPAVVAEPHVLIAMGAAGLPSRMLAARLGNLWTYAGDGIAPGQIPAERMLRDLHFRRIRPDAALYGVVGKPIGHSRSPVMHNAGFAALDLNAAYLPFEAADAADFVDVRPRALAARRQHHRAVQGVAPAVRGRDRATARRVGAINTLVVRDGRWIGANTDVDGFLAPLAGRFALGGARATDPRRRRRGTGRGRRPCRQRRRRDHVGAATRNRARRSRRWPAAAPAPSRRRPGRGTCS